MVSFAQLRDAKPGELDGAWRSWRKLVEHLEKAEDAYHDGFLQGIRKARWTGKDAEAAMPVLLLERTRMKVAGTEAASIAGVLCSAQAKISAAQAELRDVLHAAQGEYLSVGDDGSIRLAPSLPPRYANWQQYQQAANAVHDRFAAAVKKATDADTQVAAALRAFQPDILTSRHPLADLRDDARKATALAGFDPGNVPPKGMTDPKKVTAWWKSLPEEQRHLLMNAYPDKIGWANGIPSEDRDEANRTRLDARLAELQAKGANLSAFEQRDLKRLTNLDAAMRTYEAKGRDLYLLGLDSTVREKAEKDGSDGRAIVAFGNPDTATHVATYVPGTTEDLDKFGGSMNRAANLNDAASAYTDKPVSTIAWLGYDAPDSVYTDSPSGKYADAGGPKLNAFVDGLRATQAAEGNPNAHMTAVGHSYGSTVIGEAARHADDRLRVNDIMVAGSPGMRVDKAGDLHIGAGHVYAQEARGDQVPSIGRYGHGDGGAIGPPRVPSDPEFGGRRLVTDGGGHSSYWTDKDPDPYTFGGAMRSLDQQGRVVAGTAYDAGGSGNDPVPYGSGGPGESKDTWWQRLF
ncbi:alpha/beta hydrolase [Actinomadura parmotrematis]|uniref:DUF1023 domain-containing protein n=1 Tax=Actinomadura parmotrematis TaxID=2864039 RepID=A0ABS7FX86_9ACTN|nr:alpha/beta hydrolase [Actinomadura parmotrematis]MBW8484901.1 hypothetical protein [Actinomadura parmotrematis]